MGDSATPSWNYRFHDVFTTYQPVYEKLDFLSKIYDATTIYKSRYFGFGADTQIARYWAAAQDKQYPLTTVTAIGEPTLTSNTFEMDKVYAYMMNQLFVEGYRAIDLDPTTGDRRILTWPNAFPPADLTRISRPLTMATGAGAPTLMLDEEDFPFVRLDARASHAFTFTSVATSPIHTIQWRLPALNVGIPTPIMEYTSTTTNLYVRVNTAGNLEFTWGTDGKYVSPYIISPGTWYSLMVILEPAQVKFSVSPFSSNTPFTKQDTIEATGLLTATATIGRNGDDYVSIDIYQALAYMGLYTS